MSNSFQEKGLVPLQISLVTVKNPKINSHLLISTKKNAEACLGPLKAVSYLWKNHHHR